MPLISYDPSFSALMSPETGDTVFVRGVEYSRLQIGVESARLAYFCLERSDSEYRRLKEALARIDFDSPYRFRDATTGTEGFATKRTSDGAAIISIRGSNPCNLNNIVTNMSAGCVSWSEAAGYCHAGFAAAARAMLPQIRQWLERELVDARHVILTGHSLGAAVATLIASVIQPGLLVSLGSPRVGDKTFARSCEGISIARLVNCCDIVTESPPEHAMYTHICDPIYIHSDCTLLERPDEQVIRRDRARARLECLSRITALARDFTDHAPINYVRAFFS